MPDYMFFTVPMQEEVVRDRIKQIEFNQFQCNMELKELLVLDNFMKEGQDREALAAQVSNLNLRIEALDARLAALQQMLKQYSSGEDSAAAG